MSNSVRPLNMPTQGSMILKKTFFIVILLIASNATAQVRVDVADQRVTGELRRVDSLLADRQWDEAIETIGRLAASDGDRLYQIDAWRYVPVRQYTQTLLGQLPDDALVRYRELVDPTAEQDYLAGRFERVVREAYASSYTDDALLALGEAALASGDAARAYRLWEQILAPLKKTPKKIDASHQSSKTVWPRLPESDLDPAAVRARLILATILGGHPKRARAELAQFIGLHPDAQGRFAGRDNANYAEVLEAILNEPVIQSVGVNQNRNQNRNQNQKGSKNLSPKNQKKQNSVWPTFAGSAARNRTASQAVDASRIAWHYPLKMLQLSKPFLGYEHEPHRDDLHLAYHPVLKNGQIFLTGENVILGFDASSGKPLWGSDGVIYRERELAENENSSNSVRPPNGEEFNHIFPTLPEGTLGIPQFTTTIRDDRLYARLGTPLTNRASSGNMQSIEIEAIAPDTLVCLDLKAEGRLVWRIEPGGKGWAFDGTPIVDGMSVYVAMRRGGIRPESHVACFDAARGTMRWRQFICSATTRSSGGRSSRPECTHNLLTLRFDTLYFNTNLGAVASLETKTGSIRWLTLYPSGKELGRKGESGKREGHPLRIKPATSAGSLRQKVPDLFSARTLCPCVYDRGTLYIAPSDSAAIFAVDAFSGELLWSTGRKTSDAVHLLGTLGDQLIASGDHLYWIATTGERRGQVVRRFPDGDPIAAYGRGILAEGRIYWPTRERIFVFEGKQLAKTIDLHPLGMTGGNLTISGRRLLITNDREITALE